MTRWLAIPLAAAALAAAAPAPAGADPIQLKFAFPGAPQAAIYTHGVVPWTKEVEKASGGTITIKTYAGQSLASLTNVYDRINNGVADFGFALLGLFAQQFPKTTVVTMPFEARNPHEAAVAMWHLYEKGVISDEYKSVRPLAIAAFTNVAIHSRKPIHSMADLKGLRIALNSRVLGEVIERLGGTPVTMPPTELYQALSRGVIDAAGVGWAAVLPFKLDEVVNVHVEAPLTAEGMFNLMSKASYERLPEKARTAIDANSGMRFSLMMARAVQGMTDSGRKMTRAMKGQTIVQLTPEQDARWAKRVAPVITEWEKSTPDGPAVLAAFRRELGAVRAGK